MRKIWTAEEKEFLRTHYANKSTARLAAEMNRSMTSIYSQSNLMGLKKSEEFLNSSESGRLKKGSTIGYKSQFKKGFIPANKGKKQKDYMSAEAIEKTVKTRFPKGHLPHNHKPVGYERTNVDGYTEVKTKEPKTFELKHRLVYQEHFKVVLKSSDVVRFKDGNKQNFSIENLELINYTENMNRNTIHRFPEEVKEVIRLNNKLTRVLTKENEQHG